MDKEIISAAYYAGFEPSADDLTDKELEKEAQEFLLLSI